MAVPGELKGYFEAKDKFGNSSMPMKRLMDPVIKMCKTGIKTTRSLADAIQQSILDIKSDPILRYYELMTYIYFRQFKLYIT